MLSGNTLAQVIEIQLIKCNIRITVRSTKIVSSSILAGRFAHLRHVDSQTVISAIPVDQRASGRIGRSDEPNLSGNFKNEMEVLCTVSSVKTLSAMQIIA